MISKSIAAAYILCRKSGHLTANCSWHRLYLYNDINREKGLFFRFVKRRQLYKTDKQPILSLKSFERASDLTILDLGYENVGWFSTRSICIQEEQS